MVYAAREEFGVVSSELGLKRFRPVDCIFHAPKFFSLSSNPWLLRQRDMASPFNWTGYLQHQDEKSKPYCNLPVPGSVSVGVK